MHSIVLEDNSNSLRYWIYTLTITTHRMNKRGFDCVPSRATSRASFRRFSASLSHSPRTGTSKDLLKSYIQEWLWRQHSGDDPFRNIIKHIADSVIWRMQRCVNWSVPRTTVCTVRDLIVASWRKETKYTASTHGNELEEGNQEEKTIKDMM